ncbi:hypothetical protein BEWA_003550 [Theileria equi strain WA]|uniref:Uncharacterized protein n=1 Tax=Theileria equi strain WA TaxID=1537102 RepID=L0AZE0_THEEQ|nr:hypothetical protein BEWA_003550 [Theileria equi strain WA]AFZ80947.1 hypothetical protein BEWA_003550 [Theileria equi strain WA]|eukprot:XP_004830613.1 hypothetical protein BEWA_003550 [Theileria equi strain WA]
MTTMSSFYEPLGKSLSKLKNNIANTFKRYSNMREDVHVEEENTPSDLGNSRPLSLSQLNSTNDEIVAKEVSKVAEVRGVHSGDAEEELKNEYIKKVGKDFTQVGLKTYIEAVKDAKRFRERCFYTLSRRPYADYESQETPTSAPEPEAHTDYTRELDKSAYNTPLKVSRRTALDTPSKESILREMLGEQVSVQKEADEVMSYDEKLRVLQRIGIGDDYIANKVCSRYTPSREPKFGKLKPLTAFSMYARQSNMEENISQEFKAAELDTPIRIFTPTRTNEESSSVFKQISSTLDKSRSTSDSGNLLFLPIST